MISIPLRERPIVSITRGLRGSSESGVSLYVPYLLPELADGETYKNVEVLALSASNPVVALGDLVWLGEGIIGMVTDLRHREPDVS